MPLTLDGFVPARVNSYEDTTPLNGILIQVKTHKHEQMEGSIAEALLVITFMRKHCISQKQELYRRGGTCLAVEIINHKS